MGKTFANKVRHLQRFKSSNKQNFRPPSSEWAERFDVWCVSHGISSYTHDLILCYSLPDCHDLSFSCSSEKAAIKFPHWSHRKQPNCSKNQSSSSSFGWKPTTHQLFSLPFPLLAFVVISIKPERTRTFTSRFFPLLLVIWLDKCPSWRPTMFHCCF